MKRYYVICPVRGAGRVPEVEGWVALQESYGDKCHYPPRDVNQDDPTGKRICEEHRLAMILCDAVAVYWDVNSKGSHFDLGMAYALNKPIIRIGAAQPDPEGKSYYKAVICGK